MLATAQVIGGGVDVDKFSPDSSVVRDGGALFVGRILPHKGIDHLIRGLPPGMPLTIVGPRPDRETAATLADLAAGRNVSFKHGLDDDELVREYRRATLHRAAECVSHVDRDGNGGAGAAGTDAPRRHGVRSARDLHGRGELAGDRR